MWPFCGGYSWGAGGLESGVRGMPPEDAHIHRTMCPKHHDSPLHRAKPSDTGQPLGTPRIWGTEQTPPSKADRLSSLSQGRTDTGNQ